MADIGMKVVQSGKNVDEAKGVEILLTTKYPFLKLDTAKNISFQNIVLSFDNDPPEGVGTTKATRVYQYEHGYDYIPAHAFLIEVVVPPSGGANYQSVFQDGGLLSQHTAFDSASFVHYIDKKYVRFYVNKYYDATFGTPNDIRGMQIRIRSFIFVDDIGYGV